MGKDFTDSVLKKYGKGILVNGNSILEEDIKVIPLSPALNILTGGGIPEGSWVNLSSKPGVGKTTTALHFAATCQMPQYGERDVYYLDIEGRLKKRNLRGIKGLRLDKFFPVRSTEDKILSAQDFLSIGEDILKNNKKCVLIIDSYSSLCHEKELLEGVGTSTRGAGGYTLLAGFCRQMSQVVPVMKNIVVGIVQMMANVSGYGAAMIEKGGNSIMYQSDVWLRAKAMKPWEAAGKPIGQIVTWQCVKAAGEFGGIPGTEVDSYIRYGIGIDIMRELIGFACEIGLIDKPEKGAWYTCTYMQNHLDVLSREAWDEGATKLCRFQGEAKLYQHLMENPQWVILLEADLQKLLLGKP